MVFRELLEDNIRKRR